jgi:hypothetical protein
MVPNPRRLALEKVLGRVKSEGDELDRSLAAPIRLMGGREIWVGPAATTFENDLVGHRKQVQQAVRSVVASIEEQIKRMPTMVSETDSKGRWAAPSGL